MTVKFKPDGQARLIALLSPESGCPTLELAHQIGQDLLAQGRKVLLIDASEGRLLGREGIKADVSLTDVRDNQAGISDAKYVTEQGLTLCYCGSAGLDELLGIIAALCLSYDDAIVLAPDGCTPAHVRLAAAADQALMLFDSAGDRFMRAYWMLDAIRARASEVDPMMVVCGPKDESREAYGLFAGTVREFLGAPPPLSAIIDRRQIAEDAALHIIRQFGDEKEIRLQA